MRQEFLGFYKKLQKSRKRLLLRSFLFALFLIGVNIFAWFTYVSKAGLQLEGNISSWDVEFNANGKPTTKVDFYVSDMKPGMLDYSQKVIIHNLGEVSADVSYDIASLSIMGRDVDVSNKDEIIRRLISFYPFSVNLNIDSVIIQPQGYTNFSASLSWDYENQEKFYQLDSLYDYNGEFNYYNLVDGKYVVNDSVTADNFNELRNNLYLEKDDADSYFGYACGQYEKNTGKSCLAMKLVLKVTQKEA